MTLLGASKGGEGKDSVLVEDIGGVRVTVLKNEKGGKSVAIAVLRGSTDSILDDLGRAVDDGVNTYKSMCRDNRIIPGAAATEIAFGKEIEGVLAEGNICWTTMPLQNLLKVLKWFQEPRLKMLGLVL
uniref:Uncharacterized protein n=1 Tax=Oryza meridionalis TaxID=40149 RepID=A0A0E0F6X5_9ORYZ